jgi:hypothetical protein
MTELKYLPSAWLDECIPEPQENPDSFICRAGEAWVLRPPEEDAEDAENFIQRLQAGRIVMFYEHRYFGDFTLTIDACGDWTTDAPIPAEATHFRLEWNPDTIASSVDALILTCKLEEGQATIDAYWWSDYEVPLRFLVEGDAARFARIEGEA